LNRGYRRSPSLTSSCSQVGFLRRRTPLLVCPGARQERFDSTSPSGGKKSREHKVRGPVNDPQESSENDAHMERRWPPRSVEERVAVGVVEVQCRAEQAGDSQQDQRDRGLEQQPATIIPNAAERPEQQHGK